jgi:hypothetical protein
LQLSSENDFNNILFPILAGHKKFVGTSDDGFQLGNVSSQRSKTFFGSLSSNHSERRIFVNHSAFTVKWACM